MNDSKKWYQSKGVMGAATAAILTIAAIFMPSEADAAKAIVTKILAVIADIYALYGRVTATKTIQ